MESQPEAAWIDTLNSQNFSKEQQPDKIVITYLANDRSCRAYFGNQALPSNTVSTCRFRQAQTNANYIWTGIATNAALGKAMDQLFGYDCLSFSSWNGNLWKNGNGNGEKVGRTVSDEEVIVVQVDTANWQIKWAVGH